jgi:eukaryotic-like serine/threonine-protein kinase
MRPVGLSRGTRLGSYEILDLLGAGGMGEVYWGRDTRLGRDVAVKALPDRFAHDAERLARFEREAQALAALNHPNIAIIHELKEVGGSRYLIMELVDGETVGERLATAPKGLAVDDALSIGRQIADALDAAHEKGIVHRDLKPANVKITPEGRVKVLDFGLAKMAQGGSDVGSGPDGVDASQSPTLSAMQTVGGVILGTAGYMSPEQARGRPVDRRADVWAFGCVLYEMLAGRKAFPDGETVSDTLAGILTREPDWRALPIATPPRLRTLLERCLRKDPHRRLRDIGDALIEIDEARTEPEVVAAAAGSAGPSRRREQAAWAVAAAFLLSTVGLLVRAALAPEPVAREVRFDVFPPEGVALSVAAVGQYANSVGRPISPDGRSLAFVAGPPGQDVIWIRSLDQHAARALPGTEGASRPLWSPDSQFLAFFAQGRFKRVAASGGPPVVLSEEGGRDASWGTADTILVGRPGQPIARVSAAGGMAIPVTELAANETTHDYPEFLPDGRHFLYLARHGANPADWDVYVQSLESTERRLLPGIHSAVRYASTGHLLFTAFDPDILMAQPFDAQRLELAGEAFPITDRVHNAVSAPYAVSLTGDLAYLGVATGGDSELVWVDRSGRRLSTVGPTGEYGDVALSPDGRYVAFARGSAPDVFLLDLQRDLISRFTSHAAADAAPVWAPDGRTLAFLSSREPAEGAMGPANINAGNLYERAVGGIGEDRLLLRTGAGKTPTDWSRDGRYLAYTSRGDIWALPMPVSGEPVPLRLTDTPFIEDNARISPDGRWIAYQSNESVGGRQEVFVQSFPRPGARQQVSTSGGTVPRWRSDGTELLYLASDLTLMSVSITLAGADLHVGAPTPLFQTRPPRSRGRDYDVSADGRFLLNAASSEQASAPITVILNWGAGLTR